MNAIGSCTHGHDPRQCPVCAPELVERFKTIGEAFAIVQQMSRCQHVEGGGAVFCGMCGARKMTGGTWKRSLLGERAYRLASRSDLSNPFKNSA